MLRVQLPMSPRPPSRSLVDQFPRWRGVNFAPSFPAPSGVKRGGAFLLSLLAHVAVAAAVVRGGHSPDHVAAAAPRERRLEMAAPELAAMPALDEPPQPAAPAPAESMPPRTKAALGHVSSRPTAAESTPVSEPPATVSAPATAARFVMTAPVSAPVAAAGTPAPGGSGARSASEPASAPLSEREVDVGPRLLAGASPAYPASAEAAGIESSVAVELVIDARGTVMSAVALGRVGYGLDEAALAAVRGYRFAPARRNGAPVAVRMRWVVRFELR